MNITRRLLLLKQLFIFTNAYLDPQRQHHPQKMTNHINSSFQQLDPYNHYEPAAIVLYQTLLTVHVHVHVQAPLKTVFYHSL